MDTQASGNGLEFPDEAGYPDGTGTLDEGTGAFTEQNAEGFVEVEEVQEPGGVEVDADEDQGIDQLDEFDEADARDE